MESGAVEFCELCPVKSCFLAFQRDKPIRKSFSKSKVRKSRRIAIIFLWVSAGSHWIVEGQPGVVFGMLKAPNTARRFTYFVVFKHDFPASSCSAPSSVSGGGRGFTSIQEIEVSGNKLQIVHKADFEPQETPDLKESFEVDGKPVDLSGGRVFLVDLTAEPPGVKQRDVDLPEELPDPTSSVKTVETLARQTLAAIREQDKDVDSFLAP